MSLVTLTYNSPRLSSLKEGLEGIKEQMVRDGATYLYHEYQLVMPDMVWELVIYGRKTEHEQT